MRYIEASRHQGIEATRRDAPARSLQRRFSLASSRLRRAFSLTEVLLAVFILGIGVISIAALFPAGIAQQRLSTDDAMGPVVAQHAMSVIRSKVKPEDFGTFEEFRFFFDESVKVPDAFFTRTQNGDWGWMRPGFLLADNPDTTNIDETGAIDIFSHYFVRQQVQGEISPPDFDPERLVTEHPFGWPAGNIWTGDIPWGSNDPPLWGIPFSREASLVDWWERRENSEGVPTPPRRIITQHERYYPMQTDIIRADNFERRPPEYVWDCMFRRYNGRIHVAIFVYRVTSADAATARWRVPQNDEALWVSGDGMPDGEELRPPLPMRLDFVDPINPAETANTDLYPDGPWDVWYSTTAPHRPVAFVPGANTASGDVELNFNDPRQSWQEHRQWLLDQNNNVHRVMGQRLDPNDADYPVRIELSRPLQPLRVTPHWRNTAIVGVDPGANFDTPFQNIPWNSRIPAEYYANIPDPWDPGTPNPMDFTSYVETATILPDFPPAYFNWNTSFDRGVVTRIWYIPRLMRDQFGNEWRLTPVYVSVKEL